jgi:hypothetical protein
VHLAARPSRDPGLPEPALGGKPGSERPAGYIGLRHPPGEQLHHLGLGAPGVDGLVITTFDNYYGLLFPERLRIVAD